jgi:hypothetical protein
MIRKCKRFHKTFTEYENVSAFTYVSDFIGAKSGAAMRAAMKALS